MSVLVLGLCSAGSGQSGPAAEPKKVLLLFTHQPDNPGQVILEQAMRSRLRDCLPARPEIYSEYLDAVRTDLTPYEPYLVDQLRGKYAAKKFDLIVAFNPPAVQFLTRNRARLFSDVPTVFVVLDSENLKEIEVGPNMTGIWGEVDFGTEMEIALKLRPQATQAVVITGVSDWDNSWRAVIQKQLAVFENRVEISYLTGLTTDEQKQAVSKLASNTIVLFATSTRDRFGNSTSNLDVVREISAASTAPVFGSSDSQMGLGIVGGNLVSFDVLGAAGADIGARVLQGERPETITPQAVSSVPIFDWRELHRWGIDETLLPSDSTVRFKQQSVWEEYRWYWAGLSAVIVVEAVLIGALLFVRMRRRQAELENQRLSSRLEEILANVPGIVWESREQPNTELRRTTFISDYVFTMLGYTAEEWLAQPPGFGVRIVPEEDRARAREASDDAARCGKETVSEFRWYTKDGRIRWAENHMAPIFDKAGAIIGLRGVALDVTARKEAEEHARLTEEMDKAILSASPDLMFLQTVDGVYVDYQAKDINDLFVPPEEFLGKNVRDIMPPELADQFLEGFAATEEGGEPRIVEYSLPLAGVERSFEARMVRAGDKILSIVRDITDLKRSQQAALELGGRLITAQEDERARLARELHDGVMQTLASLSIELSLVGNATIQDKDVIDARMKEFSARVQDLISDIRRLSHELHPAILERLGLVPALRGFCSEVEAAHGLSLHLEVKDVPALPRNVSLGLYRVVQESLHNIIKHSGAQHARIHLSSNGGGLSLRVSDDGCGFHPNNSNGHGSLGLVSMRERVRQLNGELSITSAIGKGTSIEVTVPFTANGHSTGSDSSIDPRAAVGKAEATLEKR